MSYSEIVDTSLEAPQIDPQHLLVANELLSGKSVTDIAGTYNLSEDRVAAIVELPEVKRYVDTVYSSQGYLHRSRRLDLINRVIEAKIEEALDTGVYTKRDLLEWLKMLNDMERDAKPKGPSTAIQVNQTNNYTALLEDLFNDNQNPEER